MFNKQASPGWWIVCLLFVGTFINAIDRACLSSAAPLLIKEFRVDAATMGVALSAFFWFYLLMNIPAGRLADRFGAKVTLGWAAALWSVCSACTGLATNCLHLILARVGVGTGEAASFPVNAKIVNNHFPSRQRGFVVACYSAGLRLGFAVTPILMAYLIKNCGWRFAFYATGLGSLAWVAAWYLTYTESPPKKEEPPPAPIPMLDILRNRTVIGLVLCKFFQDYLFYLFVTWLPGYLVLERHFSIINMGLYAALPWIAGCLAQPLMGWLSDWLITRGVSVTTSRKVVIVVMHCFAASVVLAAYAKDAMTAVWLLTLSMACESAATSLLWTACTDVAPRPAAASLAGIMNSAGALAGILAPVVTGFVVKTTGNFQIALLVGGIMVILAAATMLFVVGELNNDLSRFYVCRQADEGA